MRLVPAAEKRVIGIGVPRLPAADAGHPIRRQPQPDLVGNRRADVLLQAEQAGRFTVVGPRPDVLLVAHADQRHRDPNPRALGANRALDQIIDAELAADLGRRQRRVFVVQRPAPDAEVIGVDLRERRAGFVGEAGSEVRPLRIAGEILERQHRQGDGGHAATPGSGKREDRGHHDHGEHANHASCSHRRRCRGTRTGRRRRRDDGWLERGGRGGRRSRGRSRRSRRHDIHRPDEPVALARHRLHERRRVRRIAKRLANLADRGVDAGVDVDEDVLAPESIDDLAPRDELAALLDQEDQQVHRLPPELHRTAAAAQLVGSDVQLEVAKTQRLARIEGRHGEWARRLQCHKSRGARHLRDQENSSFRSAACHGQLPGGRGRMRSPGRGSVMTTRRRQEERPC